MTLRRSLLLVVAGLTAAALLIVTAAAVFGMRQYLLNRTDEQLAAAAVLARSRTDLLAGDPEARGEAIRQVVAVTDYVVEIRTARTGTLRVVSGAPLPARPLLDQASATGEQPQNVAGYRVVVTHDGDYTALVALSLQPLRDTVRRLLLVAGVTSLIVLALLMLIARLLIARRLRPLDAIAATATDIAGGDRVRPVPLLAGPRTEAGRLTSAINKMLAQIQEALGAWQRSEHRMRSFVADASHELRTPVTSIQGYVQLIRSGVVDVKERPDVLRRLDEETTRMGSLVNSLLYLARLDASPMLRRAPVDIVGLVRDAVADASAVEPDRPLTAEAQAECVVTGDEDALRQVLANLLANVSAHTPPGTPARVRVVPDCADGFARVEVTDEGPGISYVLSQDTVSPTVSPTEGFRKSEGWSRSLISLFRVPGDRKSQVAPVAAHLDRWSRNPQQASVTADLVIRCIKVPLTRRDRARSRPACWRPPAGSRPVRRAAPWHSILAPSSALLGCVVVWAFAGVACAGHDGEELLQLTEHGVEGPAGAAAFGSRRSRVQKAWARTARVTWRCQPV